MVKPESTIPLHDSLTVLDGVWLPLPFLRFNPPRTFVDGPDNWARVQVRKLSTPDAAGNTHRVTVALDSQIAEHATSALSPVENDILNGTRFALAWRDSEVESFLDQTWIDGWLREAFTQYADGVEKRAERELHQAMRSFEYQAHWLNLLSMLGEQLTVPEVKFVTHTLSTPAIPVDLILDVGNTHTCGVIIEDHGDANDGLRQTAELQVRSLSEPQFLNEPLFTSRLEFSEARLASSTSRWKAAGRMRSSGHPLSAWVMKRVSWRCSVWARKATAVSPARVAICGTRRRWCRTGALAR